jgi:hypothetical protein
MKEKLYCDLDGKYYSKMGIVRIIKKFGLTPKDYYDEHFKLEAEGVCPNCGKFTKFTKFSYRKFCNNKCSSQYNKNAEKMWKNSSAEKRQSIINKMLNSRFSKNSKEEIEKKRIETVLKNTGFDTYSSFVSHHKKEWYKTLSEEEYNNFFDKVTKSRNQYKYHMYTLNGIQVRTQGYEKYVLDILTKYFDNTKIEVDSKKSIRYKDKSGKVKRYYPDIIIDNLLFEVKSTYTLKLHKDNVLLKMKASLDSGYIPFLVVWEPKESEMCENSLIETISSQDLTQQVRFNDYPFIGVGYKPMITEVLGIHI